MKAHRSVGLVAPVVAAGLLWSALPAPAQVENAVRRESTVRATVDRVDRIARLLNFHTENGLAQSVYVDPSVAIFEDLDAGDVVVVRYVESVIVKVRPDAAIGTFRDSTEEARRAGGTDVLQQFTAVVTVESVDEQASVVTYLTPDNRRVRRAVTDNRLLEGIKAGDRVEITLTRERAVGIEKSRP